MQSFRIRAGFRTRCRHPLAWHALSLRQGGVLQVPIPGHACTPRLRGRRSYVPREHVHGQRRRQARTPRRVRGASSDRGLRRATMAGSGSPPRLSRGSSGAIGAESISRQERRFRRNSPMCVGLFSSIGSLRRQRRRVQRFRVEATLVLMRLRSTTGELPSRRRQTDPSHRTDPPSTSTRACRLPTQGRRSTWRCTRRWMR